MTAKSVLNRIATLLMSEEVKFTDAKTADGTILQSPTFDLGESVEVIDADGKKTPAPDGEHEIALKDSEGKDVIIRIVTKDGKITERENVEEEHPEVEDEMGKMDEEVVDKKAEEETHMADEKKGALTTDEAHSLPNTTDEDPRNRVGTDKDDMKDPIIALSYKIDELEAKLKHMMEKFNTAFPEEGAEVSSLIPSGENMAAVEEDEEELPKLDGAPVDPLAKEQNSKNFGKKSADYQSSFLSKLYR